MITYDDIAQAEADEDAARLHSIEQRRLLHEHAPFARADDPAVAGDPRYEHLLGQVELARHRHEQARQRLYRMRDAHAQQQAHEAKPQARRRTRSR